MDPATTSNGTVDLLQLSDYAWERLTARMDGMVDDELTWEPVAGFTTLAWRVGHLIRSLSDARNAVWLGLEASGPPIEVTPATAADARARLDEAYTIWRDLLTQLTEPDLWQPLGAVAGPYGDADRASFVLHELDELIHHGAEVALLRDLYRDTHP